MPQEGKRGRLGRQQGNERGSSLVSLTTAAEPRPSLHPDWLNLQAPEKKRRSCRFCLRQYAHVSRRLAPLSSLLPSPLFNPPGFFSVVVVSSSRRRPRRPCLTARVVFPATTSKSRIKKPGRPSPTGRRSKRSLTGLCRRTGRVFSHKGAPLKKPLISLKHLHCSSRFARTFQARLFQGFRHRFNYLRK